ncbi:MAG: LEPR-XLL domain-containing protein [Verrucomicrobiota bacterium]
MFELEMLEPRILLSADALVAVAHLGDGSHSRHSSQATGFAVAHEEISAAQTAVHQTSAYNPADQVANIFEGISGEAISPVASSSVEI